MSIGAHGFAGFNPTQTGEFDRANYAFYIDLEADVTDERLVQGTLWFEDFDGFGTTTIGVDSAGTEVSRERLVELENFNPENRGIFTILHRIGSVRLLGRASFYDDWVQADGGTAYNIRCQVNEGHCHDGETIFDLEAVKKTRA
jgi:hypothetical protein